MAWAVLPLVTCGLATPFSIGFAAFWLRSVFQAVAAFLYLLCVVIFIAVSTGYEEFDDIPEPTSTVVSFLLVASWLGGVIHSGILVPAMVRARHAEAHYVPVRHAAPMPPPMQHATHSSPAMRQATHASAPVRHDGPQFIGPYRVLQALGRGGQGAVYLAATPHGAKVAVKVLHELGDEVSRQRFLREVEAARRVATFSTARVLDVSINGPQAYIVSEYVDGPSLEQLVRRYGPRDADSLTRLALSTSGALAAIHKAGIVHRDFKPSNILIGADGPRVIDFGIARALDQVTVTSGKMVGTPPYMSPEQLSGQPVGPPSDVFSWGVTMLFAATGRPAFGEDSVPAVFHRVLTVHPDLSPLPPSLRRIVGTCLDKTPENRPSASDVMLAIVH